MRYRLCHPTGFVASTDPEKPPHPGLLSTEKGSSFKIMTRSMRFAYTDVGERREQDAEASQAQHIL